MSTQMKWIDQIFNVNTSSGFWGGAFMKATGGG